MHKMLALGYRDVYITPVVQGGTEEDVLEVTPSQIPRDKRLTTRIIPLMAKKEIMNIRIGPALLEIISHYSKEMDLSQNAFILDAIRNSLDQDHALLDSKDIGLATDVTVQYSIRMDTSMAKAIKAAATEKRLAKSKWVLFAMISYLSRLTADSF